jgi:hypothetical protein
MRTATKINPTAMLHQLGQYKIHDSTLIYVASTQESVFEAKKMHIFVSHDAPNESGGKVTTWLSGVKAGSANAFASRFLPRGNCVPQVFPNIDRVAVTCIWFDVHSISFSTVNP